MDATPRPEQPRPEAAHPAGGAGPAPAAVPGPGDVPEEEGMAPGPDGASPEPAGAAPLVPGGGDGPRPLGVERAPTGHGAVDALLERLGDADHLPADGHPAVYEDVHRGLRETLAALDAHPRPGPPNDHRS
ncbi:MULTISPECIES: hypothetical protein [Streptomyces]|uniref:Uncharacterized protein n=3 Tax=Streptomyces fradiae TaxID=1906 RepID=A0ABQ6XKM9_STRFR|nr:MULTISPECIES: hypothetical protein [Streptomyces]KAF0646330.1 hypothetical protein K701_29325 [Streptomyces fradiae ATCC 10745 = DSM 40063]